MIRYRENDFAPTGDQYRAWLRARLRVLDARIAEYPFWGAALTAMDEERRGVRRALGMDPQP